jgi:hypothetical protein
LMPLPPTVQKIEPRNGNDRDQHRRPGQRRHPRNVCLLPCIQLGCQFINNRIGESKYVFVLGTRLCIDRFERFPPRSLARGSWLRCRRCHGSSSPRLMVVASAKHGKSHRVPRRQKARLVPEPWHASGHEYTSDPRWKIRGFTGRQFPLREQRQLRSPSSPRAAP